MTIYTAIHFLINDTIRFSLKKCFLYILISSILHITCACYLPAEDIEKHENVFWTPFQASLFTEGQLFSDSSYVGGLRLGLVASRNYGMFGLDLNLGASITKDKAAGLQLAALGGNTVHNHFWGMQVSGFENEVHCLDENLSSAGLQISGWINQVHGNFIGIQLSGIYNIASERLYGIQIGGLGNLASSASTGLQIGTINGLDGDGQCIQIGGLNVHIVSKNDKPEHHIMYGAQIGIYNYAKRIYGMQVGACNCGLTYDDQIVLGGSMTGIQVGVSNITKKINGLQVGVINYCNQLTGIQIGVLNIVTESPMPMLPIINAHF